MVESAAPRRFNVSGDTNVGLSRLRNEDSWLQRHFGAWTLVCVADGLGGHARGDWASRRAVDVFAEALVEAVEPGGEENALREAADAANHAVYTEAPKLEASGAASTLVAVLLGQDAAHWLNVGDSRLYRFSSGILEQVSQDHSLVAEHVRAGMLPESALRTHPNRNVVSRTIGFEAEVRPDTGALELAAGDSLLLCSDGLFGPVEDDLIASVLSEHSGESAVTRLIELANEAGGPDNITVALVHAR